jgi:hypothetical protein
MLILDSDSTTVLPCEIRGFTVVTDVTQCSSVDTCSAGILVILRAGSHINPTLGVVIGQVDPVLFN